VGPRKLVLDGVSDDAQKGVMLWCFRLESNPDECKGKCNYKGWSCGGDAAIYHVTLNIRCT